MWFPVKIGTQRSIRVMDVVSSKIINAGQSFLLVRDIFTGRTFLTRRQQNTYPGFLAFMATLIWRSRLKCYHRKGMLIEKERT